MHLTFRNINEAFQGLVEGFHTGRISTKVLPSRYGEVIAAQEPITITYTHPTERVLFNKARDHNCFLALYEALWMLAGRNDVSPLAYCCSRMPEFSDDGKTFNGAYGYRWRHVLEDDEKTPRGQQVDQLQILIDHLRRKPESRRAVLRMWTVEDDLLKIDVSRDVCCNLNVLFSVREGLVCNRSHRDQNCPCAEKGHDCQVLDITVTNRSNDLTWGLLGSNYVCFSVLQEYMAAHLEVGVGKYHHFTNNLHAYTNKWHPEMWLADQEPDKYTLIAEEGFDVIPLVKSPAMFDQELLEFVQFHGSEEDRCARGPSQRWKEPFFNTVAGPMLDAFHIHKLGNPSLALDFAAKIAADDWRIAAERWLRRRYALKGLIAEWESEEGYDPDFAV